MIEILSHNATMLSLRITHEGRDVRVDVVMVREITDLLIGSLEGSINRYGITRGLQTWTVCNELTVMTFVEYKPLGVSVADLVTALGEDEEQVSKTVKRLHGSKAITAKPIGKCPINARAKLYRLSEILTDFEKISPLSKSEKRRIEAILKTKEREPA